MGYYQEKIDTVNDSRQIGGKIHIYLSSDSVIRSIKEKIILIILFMVYVKVEIAKVDAF